MARHRGNPNWGRPMPPYRAVATEFEVAAKHLRLRPDTYVSSIQLRRWCERHKNRYYIPEWLLKEWGILVEVHYGVDAA
jgi:hypothetical protein